MMDEGLFEDIRIFLPKYLSSEEQQKLFDELSQFPKNLDKRFFTSLIKKSSSLLQGDGFQEIFMPNYDESSFVKVKGILLSNTCDASLENERFYQPYVTFSPIYDLHKYQNVLLERERKEIVQSHIDAIRKQKITSILYIPPFNQDNIECFSRLDCCFSVPLDKGKNNDLIERRIFSLSNYGFYLLLLKISIHFSRAQERVSRNLT
ncbi:MAG: hypothetical protein PVG30_04150 [Gammaproteobacteria bacterium]|jgi:hypothetical protein